ncbi:MAG: hypothetical protein ACI8PZ_003780 [Myxococcota bacterium]|jgi:hypothetical protein
MLALALGSALALAAPVVAFTVVNPEGKVLFDRETPVPVTLRWEDEHAATPRPLTLDARIVGNHLAVTGKVSTSKGGREKVLATDVAGLAAEQDGAVSVTTRSRGIERTWRVQLRWADITPPPTAAPGPATASRYGLFWDDTRLVDDPRARSAGTRRAQVDRTDPTRQTSPLKIVYPWGNRAFEVETVATDLAPHCHSGAAAPGPTNRQYYAPAEDQVQVLVAPVRHLTADGAVVLLQPGLAVVALGDGRHRVRHGDLDVVLPLDPGVVGYHYVPPRRFLTRGTGATLPAGPLAEGVETTAPMPVLGRTGVRIPITTIGTSCVRVELPR